MTLLELITKASSDEQTSQSVSDYPIVFDPSSIFLGLNPKGGESNASSLPIPVTGWKISQSDYELLDLAKKFFAKLDSKLRKTPNNFGKEEFSRILKTFLESVKEKFNLSIVVEPSDDGRYTRALVEKSGNLIGKDIAALILEASVGFEMWELVETLIVNRFVRNSCYTDLVPKLVEKERSDLLCLCIKHASDFQSSELLLILQHFLSLRPNSVGSEVNVRNEWEKQALSAIEKATDMSVISRKVKEAKEAAKAAAILLMVAHDGFSSAELCLHYLLASENLDDVVLASSISKLNVIELTKLIRYLGKWLKKYERFPQAVPCPKASTLIGLTACDWVPKLEDVAKCLSLVLDQNFSALVLHPEFHDELRSLELMVSSLASEANFCISVANVSEKLG